MAFFCSKYLFGVSSISDIQFMILFHDLMAFGSLSAIAISYILCSQIYFLHNCEVQKDRERAFQFSLFSRWYIAQHMAKAH